MRDPTVKLLGAGHVAPDADPYRSLIERLGLTDRLQWVGSSSDVALLHAASDAFVLPTRYEPWGLVIVEALGSGLPVVTSRLAGAALTVEDGKTGRLLRDPEDPVELAEALRWALSDAPAGSRDDRRFGARLHLGGGHRSLRTRPASGGRGTFTASRADS